MCNSVAISKEHVPPACLFPEEKDIKTSIFRHNLITVPSCDEHNSRRSSDDEFLMMTLAGIIGNNVIGYFHNLTKVRRALDRNQSGALTQLFKDTRNETVNTRPSPTVEVIVTPVDYRRLQSCIELIAYGLYYHKFQKRFEGEIRIVMDFLKYNNEVTEQFKLVCRKRFELEAAKPLVAGANPEIFKFQFFEPDEWGLIALRIKFYEGASVYICFLPSGLQRPYFLGAGLINAGIKSFVNFPDGSIFEFN